MIINRFILFNITKIDESRCCCKNIRKKQKLNIEQAMKYCTAFLASVADFSAWMTDNLEIKFTNAFIEFWPGYVGRDVYK